jgi:hypothetical protein
MGFFDWLGGRKEEGSPAEAGGGSPFKISYRFSPLRLKAHKDSKVSMNVTVRNTSGSKHLVSVDVELPRGNKTGLDVSSSQRHHEERMGEMNPGESKSFSLSIYGSPMTKQGEIPVNIKAYAHYLNYNKVLEQASKTAKLRII